MSRGPGRIERAVAAVFTAEPDEAFTTEDLCERVFKGANRIEKKHRVSVLRAAKKVCECRDGWSWFLGEGLGGTLVFFNPYSVPSYAMARILADQFTYYRTGDKRVAEHWIRTREDVRSHMAPGGKSHHHLAEGGAWWRHVQLNIAERDGDTASELVEALQAQEVALRRALGFH